MNQPMTSSKFFCRLNHNGFVVSKHSDYNQALTAKETDDSIEELNQQEIDEYNKNAQEYWSNELSKMLRG